MQCFTTIHLPPPSMLDNIEFYAKKSEELEEMLDKFGDSEDEVSRKLLKWGNEFLDEMAPHANATIEKIKEFGNRFFHSLKYDILRDDLRSSADNSIVFTIDDTPVIGHEFGNTWLWSQRVYKRCYKACNKISPIDGQEMQEEPEVHPVAQAFIQWMAPLLPSSLERTSALAPPPTETDLLIEKVAFQRLGFLANLYRMTKDGEAETNAILANADASQQEALKMIKRAHEQYEQDKKILSDEKEALKAQFTETLQQLDAQYSSNNASIQAQIEEQQKSINEARANSEAMAKEQRDRLDQLESQGRLTQESYEKEKENLKKIQDTKVKELDKKQAATELKYETKMEQMQKNHAEAFRTFNEQAAKHNAEMESLKKSHVQLTQKTMLQEGMIVGLEGNQNILRSDLEAEKQNKPSKSNNCSLM